MPFKRHGRSQFIGHGFVNTGSLTMKHGRNGVGVSISRCRNFHKNTINLTESNKSLKTNLILKNKIVSYLGRGTHWVKNLAPFLLCENVVLQPNYIVSKIENIPPIGKLSNIKKKRPLLLARSVDKTVFILRRGPVMYKYYMKDEGHFNRESVEMSFVSHVIDSLCVQLVECCSETS